MIIRCEDYGILPNTDCSEKLDRLFKDLKRIEEEKILLFIEGTYYFNSDFAKEIFSPITNTSGAKEYKNKEDIFKHKTLFLFENVKNFVLDGQGSTFIIDGKVTNMIFRNCENVTVKNLRITVKNPNLHKLTVINSNGRKVTYKMDNDSVSVSRNGKWQGKGYSLGYKEKCKIAGWTNSVLPDEANVNFRTTHPLLGAFSVKEKKSGIIEATYFKPKKYVIGQSFYIFDAHRTEVGVLIDRCKNINFDRYEQNFNYALGVVAQVSEDVTITNCRFAPEENGEMEMASLADLTHFCMCKGKITVKDSYFSGAGDDAINVHGIHFIVDKVKNDEVTVSFRHPQTWGFDPFDEGDEIEFIDRKTLRSVSNATIIMAKMPDDYHIILKLDKVPDNEIKGMAIENVTKCPCLVFQNNTIKNVATRGVLYTSRGKCIIKDNHFIACNMSGVCISDDANNWFESGMCKDVLIENNIFDYCGETPILIKPEIKKYSGGVHSNIKITNNIFKRYPGVCISALACDDLTVKGNVIPDNKKSEIKQCRNVITDF